MREQNTGFFNLYGNLFFAPDEELGKEKALEIFRKGCGLKAAYNAAGFRCRKTEDFVRVVMERDESVGLRVKFPSVGEKTMVYRFHDDPFSETGGVVNSHNLDDTYMAFKVSYLVGKEWPYRMTKHLWRGDPYTEHIIEW